MAESVGRTTGVDQFIEGIFTSDKNRNYFPLFGVKTDNRKTVKIKVEYGLEDFIDSDKKSEKETRKKIQWLNKTNFFTGEWFHLERTAHTAEYHTQEGQDQPLIDRPANASWRLLFGGRTSNLKDDAISLFNCVKGVLNGAQKLGRYAGQKLLSLTSKKVSLNIQRLAAVGDVVIRAITLIAGVILGVIIAALGLILGLLKLPFKLLGIPIGGLCAALGLIPILIIAAITWIVWDMTLMGIVRQTGLKVFGGTESKEKEFNKKIDDINSKSSSDETVKSRLTQYRKEILVPRFTGYRYFHDQIFWGKDPNNGAKYGRKSDAEGLVRHYINLCAYIGRVDGRLPVFTRREDLTLEILLGGGVPPQAAPNERVRRRSSTGSEDDSGEVAPTPNLEREPSLNGLEIASGAEMQASHRRRSSHRPTSSQRIRHQEDVGRRTAKIGLTFSLFSGAQ